MKYKEDSDIVRVAKMLLATPLDCRLMTDDVIHICHEAPFTCSGAQRMRELQRESRLRGRGDIYRYDHGYILNRRTHQFCRRFLKERGISLN